MGEFDLFNFVCLIIILRRRRCYARDVLSISVDFSCSENR